MASATLVGQVLDGKYSIERPLGKGGMGTVYLATHIGTGRPVAVKVIAPDFMDRTEFVERFRREAQAAGRLRHPNVVDVTDFGFSPTSDGSEVAYLVMEYLDGCTLGEILDEEKRLPVAWSIGIIEQICSAVEEAHRQGIIHRDLKPDNIWLEPNQRGGYTVKVLDFGIAKLEESQFTRPLLERMGGPEAQRQTVGGQGAPETIVDGGPHTNVEGSDGTVVSESETLSLDSEISGEASAAVNEEHNSTVNLESGTAIMNEAEPAEGPSSDLKRTVVVGAEPRTANDERQTPSTAALTRMGAVLGTPLYMSPEQCRGEQLTPRSDIYSLAVIAYQMLSGKLPFEGDFVEVMEGHKNRTPAPIQSKGLKKKLRATIMQSLAKDPVDRPQSAEIFANKLKANSEGLGSLFTEALVIFGERLPKLLLLTVITMAIPLLLTFTSTLINFGIAAKLFEDSLVLMLISMTVSSVNFFLQQAAVALLTGMMTWIVGQVVAYPLRPLNLRAAFREARSHLRSLSGTVIASVLIATIGFVFVLIPGIWLKARYMMIAPAVMMEGVRGREAFRRSVELYKRAAWMVFATASIIFLINAILPGLLGLSISSIVGNIEKSHQISKMKAEGVKPEPTPKAREADSKKKEDQSGVSFSWGSKGLIIGDREEGENDNFRIRSSIIEGTFKLVWTPIHLVLLTFFSIISALIYFKTRQAGGDSMQELLNKLNRANLPQSKWQERVNRRLIQSGKLTSGPR